MTYLARVYQSPAQLNAMLLVDAARWHDGRGLASVFSDAFRRAAHLAYRYAQHRRNRNNSPLARCLTPSHLSAHD